MDLFLQVIKITIFLPMKFSFFLSQNDTEAGHQVCLSFFSKNTKKKLYKFPLPFAISAEDWDIDKQRPFDIYCKKYKKLNYILNAVKIGISGLLGNRANASAKVISEVIMKICSEQGAIYPQGSLLEMMGHYLQAKQYSISLSTYRRYQVFMRLIEKFEGFLSKHIFIQEINNSLFSEFYTFGKEEKYSESTLNRTAEFIKTILNFAELQGITTNIRRLKIPKAKVTRKIMILEDEEIKKIKQIKAPESLNHAKDWLVISCYAGQRISDFMRFNIRQVVDINGKKCISFFQQKTGKAIILPLHPIVLNIIKKYGNSFPPPIESSLYNKQIKEVAFLAGINQEVSVRKRIGFRVQEVLVEKWQNVSSHIGRRSFASNFYGKIPTPLLIQATGHGSEQVFLNYINNLSHTRIIKLNDYFEKIYAEAI